MQIKQYLAVTMSAWQLEYLKPQEIDDPKAVAGKLSTFLVEADSIEEATAKMEERNNTHGVLLKVMPFEFELTLSIEHLAVAGAKAFQAEAAAIRAKAFKDAEVYEEKARRLLAIEYTAAPPDDGLNGLHS